MSYSVAEKRDITTSQIQGVNISLEAMNATIFGGSITILQSIVPLLLCLNICSFVLFWLVRGREQIALRARVKHMIHPRGVMKASG